MANFQRSIQANNDEEGSQSLSEKLKSGKKVAAATGRYPKIQRIFRGVGWLSLFGKFHGYNVKVTQ